MDITWKRAVKEAILEFVEEENKLKFTRKEIMESKLDKVFEIVDSDAEEKETIFRKRLRQLVEDLYIEKKNENTYKFNYGWLPLFKEISHKLLEYENNQEDLLDLLKEMKSKRINVIKLTDVNENEEDIPLKVMDPFTFFINFNRSMKIENRLAILKFLKDKWSLRSQLPDDFKGIPTFMPLMGWVFRFKKDRKKDDINNLWKFFKHIIKLESKEGLDENLFNKILGMKGMGGALLSHHMFTIRPDLFLPLSNTGILYIKKFIKKDLKAFKNFNYTNYLNFIEISQNKIPNKTFYEISHFMWVYGNIKNFWLNRSKENYENLLKNKKVDVKTYTEEGNKRQAYSDFEKASINDNVYVYEVSGEKQLKAIAKVMKGIHENKDGNKVITVKLEEELENPLSLKLIHEETDIDHMGKVFHELSSGEVGKLKELIKKNSINYYWLNRGKETSNKLLKNGELIVKTTWEDGTIMQNYEDFQNCKKEDIVFCYEVSPAMELFAIAKVIEELHENKNGEEVLKIKLVEKLSNSISMEKVKKNTEITQMKSVIHKLEKTEVEKLKKLLKNINTNYWIFNYNPKEYNVMDALKDDMLKTSQVTAHKDKIQKDDKFVIYVGGKNNGIYGLGKIVSNIKYGKEKQDEFEYSKRAKNEERNYVKVKVKRLFMENPITYQEIKENDILKDANFGIMGSNFELKEEEYKEILKIKDIKNGDDNMENKFYKNTIFYGPPGTGKTYNVVNRALEIIDGEVSAKRHKAINRFDDLRESGQIEFITFHQSYSYEEFIEGLKPITDEESGDIKYEIRDGVFKKIASNAKRKSKNILNIENIENRNFYKLSLGNKDESEIFDYCIKKNVVAIGWGNDIDFTECDTKEKITKKVRNNEIGEGATNYIYKFKNLMKKGDIVFVSHGNLKLKAIGKVTGDYFYDNEANIRFNQFRKVEWLYVLDDDYIDVSDILKNKQFSQQTIYSLSKDDINFNYLNNIGNENKKYVIIIDEINRGNISKVFGELITLIEEDKRLGKENEMRITLPYSKEDFGVPDNLYLIGTMNTADRSIALIDTALRRRFTFEEMMPEVEILKDLEVKGINISKMLKTINDRIEFLYDRDHTIGHSYFMQLNDFNDKYKLLCNIFSNKIIPLLQEYFYDDWENIQIVLGDSEGQLGENIKNITEFDNDINTDRFIQSKEFNEIETLGFDHDNYEDINTFQINPELEKCKIDSRAFIKIYDEKVRKNLIKNEKE